MPGTKAAERSIRGTNVVWRSVVQVLTFIASTTLVVAFGLLVAFR